MVAVGIPRGLAEKAACPLFLALWATAASAASISGTVTGGGGPVGSAQVRLWVDTGTGKGFSFTAAGGQMMTADASGHYTFSTVGAGRYLIDARGGNLADRWFEADGGSGYVDATVLTVGASDMLTGVDLVMDVSAGIDGVGQIAGGLVAGLLLRAELVSDPRVHHNDATQTDPHQGEYHLRGLPPGTWRVALHDQNGVYADALGASTFAVAMGANAAAGTVNLVAAAMDPYEPNNTQPTATFVDAGYFQQSTPFVTSGARIAPLNTGDVDWYCTSMRSGDRLVANAVGQLALETGATHESPWVDPVMSLWRPDDAGTWQKVLEGDDNGPLVLDALIDTGELDAGGPLCVAVTTYGDTAYSGTSQASAGDYQLIMKMGNRGPSVTTTGDGGVVTINEGDTYALAFGYVDPDHDPLTATWDLRGASSSPATQGSFNTATGMSTFMWTASQTAARDSPYVLTIKVGDGELTRTVTVTIQVLAVNVPPSVPVPLSPIDGGSVPTATPQLVCSESSDLDQQTTTYEFQLEYGDGGQAGSALGVDGGWIDDGGAPPQVALGAAPIPENSRVRWRVRAFDGHPANGYSPWSAYASFLVDVNNDPPLAPEITKPADGDEVLVQKPTIEVASPVDPEGDAMDLFVQLATDAAFMTTIDTSGPLHAGATPTLWTVAQTLDWDGTYYARARAIDVRGGNSPYSDVVSFHVRKNQPPSVPPFVDPDLTVCNMGFTPTKPMSMTLGQSVDPEMDSISVQLQIFLASEDPATAAPAFDETRLQVGGGTTFDVSTTPIPMNLKHRARARALDAYGLSQWGECVFTVGSPPMGTGGGGGTGTGTGGGEGGGSAQGGGNGGGGVTTKGGCGCGSAEGLLALAALAMLRRRSRSG